MHVPKIVPVFALALGLMPQLASAGFPGFNPIVEPPAPEAPAADTFHVVFKGVACFTDPCPSYDALTETGDVIELSAVIFPSAAENEIPSIEALSSGIQVEGTLVPGSWEIGGPGTTLVVETIVEMPSVYSVAPNGIVCFMAPCPTLTATDLDGEEIMFSSLDLSLLAGATANVAELRAQITAGEFAVTGFIKEGDFASGTQLVVTHAQHPELFSLSSSGVVCVMAPCPTWSIEATASNFSRLVDGFSLAALKLSDVETAELLGSLQGGIALQGVVSPRHLHPGKGDIFFVTGL